MLTDFGTRKREIHADPSIKNFFLNRDIGLDHLVQLPDHAGPSRVVPGGEPCARAGVWLLTMATKSSLLTLGLQTQDPRSFAVPEALLGQVIIAGSKFAPEVSYGGIGLPDLRRGNHPKNA
jgi:hypothetical protein